MKILAVDYGDSRTGLAACDRTEFLASPIGIIQEKSMAKTIEKIVYASREYEAGMVVVGLPRNMDGSEGARAQKCRKVAELLAAIVDIPVCLWDERSTTAKSASRCWMPLPRRSFWKAFWRGAKTTRRSSPLPWADGIFSGQRAQPVSLSFAERAAGFFCGQKTANVR